MRTIHFFLLPLVIACAYGCTDLKGINKLAVTSSQNLDQPLPYGHHDYCYDTCYSLDNTTDPSRYPCNCALADSADSAFSRLAHRLGNYFAALARLSGSNEIINIDTATGGFSAGKYGALKITSTDVAVFHGVATAIQDLVNLNFKTKHTSENLRRFGDTIEMAIKSMLVHITIMDSLNRNLRGVLLPQFIAYNALAPPGPQRFAVAYAYNRQIADLDKGHLQLRTRFKVVSLIRDDFGILVSNAENLNSKGLKQRVLALVNNITFLSSH